MNHWLTSLCLIVEAITVLDVISARVVDELRWLQCCAQLTACSAKAAGGMLPLLDCLNNSKKGVTPINQSVHQQQQKQQQQQQCIGCRRDAPTVISC